jgi:adenine deaminase
MSFSISGHIVDLLQNRIFEGTVIVENGKISSIKEEPAKTRHFILPGFVDAHIHIESSMLVPSEFARIAVTHGTVATVSDPHEIGNVLGLQGIRYMIQNGKNCPFHFFFGASSCVPATAFETAGAVIGPDEILALFEQEGLKYLSEMMNFPGVLNKDPEVMKKIAIAKRLHKPIDGHAPGLRGIAAKNYIEAGISTDHECTSLNEALEKINYGMKIIIREGSAAKNYNALHPLIKQFPKMVMFCHDDQHPDDLVKGHINQLVSRSIALNYDLMDVLRCASLNPIHHYGLEVGLLQKGNPADFIVVNDLQHFSPVATYIKGEMVAKEGKSLIQSVPVDIVNNFNCSIKKSGQLVAKAPQNIPAEIPVIQAIAGELITKKLLLPPKVSNGNYVSDPKRDILKLAVINRYNDTPPAIAFINGFSLQQGALASSIAHDSHNVIAVGVDDLSLCNAINAVIESKGGIAAASGDTIHTLPLSVGGLMSHESGYEVADRYSHIKQQAKNLGSTLPDPFMTLSFMALLVIPSLKLSDRGLFDGETFNFIEGWNIG